MKVLQFIIKIEFILIILSILLYVPITIAVFLPHLHRFTSLQVNTHASLHQQMQQSFFIGLQNNCTMELLQHANQYCLERCTGCEVKRSGECQGEGYEVDGVRYCGVMTGNEIVNGSLVFNKSLRPMWEVSEKGTVTYFDYAPSNRQSCEGFLTRTSDLQQYSNSVIFTPFQSCSSYLWFTSLPILAIYLTLLLADRCVKTNLRKYIMLMFLVIFICEVSLIVRAIQLYVQSKVFQDDITTFVDLCVIGTSADVLADVKVDYGISVVFSFFLGVCCLILSLMVAAEIVLLIVQYKYHRLKNKNISETVYELQSL